MLTADNKDLAMFSSSESYLLNLVHYKLIWDFFYQVDADEMEVESDEDDDESDEEARMTTKAMEHANTQIQVNAFKTLKFLKFKSLNDHS